MTARFRCRRLETCPKSFASKPGATRHRQHAARLRVEHDRRAVRRVPLRDRRAQHRLDLRLERVVERQEDVAPRPRRRRADDVDRAAERVPDDRLLAGVPGEVVLEPELEACEALVVDARVAEHLRRDRVLRVRAPLLGVEVQPREALPLQRGGPLRVGLPLDVDEALRLVEQLREDRVRVDAQRVPAWTATFCAFRPGAGRRRPSSPARRSRAGRPSGRRSCRGRPASSPSRGAAARRGAPAQAPGSPAAKPRAPASARTRARNRQGAGGSGGSPGAGPSLRPQVDEGRVGGGRRNQANAARLRLDPGRRLRARQLRRELGDVGWSRVRSRPSLSRRMFSRSTARSWRRRRRGGCR